MLARASTLQLQRMNVNRFTMEWGSSRLRQASTTRVFESDIMYNVSQSGQIGFPVSHRERAA